MANIAIVAGSMPIHEDPLHHNRHRFSKGGKESGNLGIAPSNSVSVGISMSGGSGMAQNNAENILQ